MRRFGLFILLFPLLIACGGPVTRPHKGGRSSFPTTQALRTLDRLGFLRECYAVLSTDPGKEHPLTVDYENDRCHGEVQVKSGSTADLSVVHYISAGQVVGGKRLSERVRIAHFTRTGVVANSPTVEVVFEAGDEETENPKYLYDPDGDGATNIVEIAYDGNPADPSLVPVGPKVAVSLLPNNTIRSNPDIVPTWNEGEAPPANLPTLTGDEKIRIDLFPINLDKGLIEILEPDFACQLVEPEGKRTAPCSVLNGSADEVQSIDQTAREVYEAVWKRILEEGYFTVNLETARLHVGDEAVSGRLGFRVTDSRYRNLSRLAAHGFLVQNGTDNLGPARVFLGLFNNEKVRGKKEFDWVIDDPSGIDPASLSIGLKEKGLSVPFTMERLSDRRYRSLVKLDVSQHEDDFYTLEFRAKDLLGNGRMESVRMEVDNSCGNGTIEPGEDCDDGNRNDTDSCTAQCVRATCGDGIKWGGREQCDDGNRVNADSCTNVCEPNVCGDGFVGPGERCDDGNGIETDSCTNLCKLAACGDGFIGPQEECDDGNNENGDTCTNSCRGARCQDGILGPGEVCDDGNSVNTDSCTNACQLARCGDAIVGPGEVCDDGNRVDTDNCPNHCRGFECGDAIVSPGEGCDDGNDVNTDSCTNSCLAATCGDGVIGPNEECDDANAVNTDSCTNISGLCQLARCGDGFVAPTNNEECDDGNTRGNDGCSATCLKELVRIEITSPVDNSTVQDFVTIRATATPAPTITSFDVIATPPYPLNDQNGGMSDFYSNNWDIRGMADGTVLTIGFEATDGVTVPVIDRRQVTVDNFPNITLFTTDATEANRIQEGGTATLSWRVGNFSTLSINNGVGDVQGGTGSVQRLVTNTTTFTLTAIRTNALASGRTSFPSTAQVTVYVNHAPVFAETQPVIPVQDPKNPVTFSWDVTDPDGDPLTTTVSVYKGSSCSGSVVATPAADDESAGVTGLEPRTDYAFQVVVDDNQGGSDDRCFTFTTGDTNLMGWWRFNGNANDSSGRGHNLTPAGALVLTNGVATFNGSDSYLHVSRPDNLDSPQTLEVRLKVDTNNSGTFSGTFIDKRDGTGDGYIWRLAGGNMLLETDEGYVVENLSANTWTHLVITHEEGFQGLYVNGRLVDYEEAKGLIGANAGDFVIGADLNGATFGDYFKGEIDDVALYDRVLTVDEIRRSCRRTTAVSDQLSAVGCPDPREPIILTPLPGQILPPTRTYWSWRGERGVDATPLYPTMEYEVRFDVDLNQDDQYLAWDDLLNQKTDSQPATSGDMEYYVESRYFILSKDRNYRLRITPIENGTTLAALESTRTFFTDNSVVAWWDFYTGSGTRVFDVVNGFDGALVNFERGGWTTGLLDSALNFDGFNDYVQIATNSGLDRIHRLTLEAWVNPNLSRTCGLINKSTDGGGNGYALLIESDGVAHFRFGDGMTGVVGDATVNVGTGPGWRQIAATHDGSGEGVSGTGRIYHDGTSGNSAIAPIREGQVGTPPAIEIARNSGGSRYCSGLIDEVRIYNRALGPHELCNSYLAFCQSARSDAGVTCDTSCIGDD